MKWLDMAAAEGAVATAEAVAVVAEAVAGIATPTVLPWAVDAGGKPGQPHSLEGFLSHGSHRVGCLSVLLVLFSGTVVDFGRLFVLEG